MNRAPVSAEDAAGLERLVDRTLGNGFKLAIVELATPVEREALRGWLTERVTDGEVRGVDLGGLRGDNVWQELRDAVGQAPPRTLLFLWGLEETPEPEQRLRQLNVQRDVLVRDLPFLWVLVLHPAQREAMLRSAPDFCDFAVRWIEAAPTPLVRAATLEPSRPRERMPPLPLESGPSPARELLEAGWEALQREEFDAVGDALERLALRQPLPEELERGRQVLEGYWRSEVGPNERAIEVLEGVSSDGLLGGVASLRLVQVAGTVDEAERWLAVAERALSVAPPQWRAEMVLTRQRGLANMDRWKEALEALDRGVAALGELEPWTNARVCRERGWLLRMRGEYATALRRLKDEALPFFEREAAPIEVALLKLEIGQVLREMRRIQEAGRFWDAAAVTFREHGAHRDYAVTRAMLARTAKDEEALRIMVDEVLPAMEAHGTEQDVAVASVDIAVTLCALHRWDEATARVREAIKAFERLGELVERASALRIQARICAATGRISEAIRILRGDVVPVYERAGRLNDLAWARFTLAKVLQARGQFRDRVEAKKLLELAASEAPNDPALAEALRGSASPR